MSLPNSMTIGPADNYCENGTDPWKPEIPKWTDLEWERGDLIDRDHEEREEYYIMTAESDGVTYEGTGIYSCGELILVENIEIKI